MSRRPPEEEMSGTFLDAVRDLGRSLGSLSASVGLLGLLATTVGLIILITVSEFRIFSYAVLGIGMALLILALVTARRNVAQAVTGRRGRYGANTVLMTVAFIAIVGVLNFISYDNTARMDVTATNQFSLAPRTMDILKNLNEPVKAIAFFDKTDLAQEAVIDTVDNMLHEFEVRSDKFSYEVVNPNVERDKALLYGFQFFGQVAFVGEESGIFELTFGAFPIRRADPVNNISALYQASRTMEQNFVTPLLEIAGEERKSIYFLTGHGERDIDDSQSGGYGLAAAALAAENYDVEILNLQLQTIVERVTGESDEEGDGDTSQVTPTVIVVAGPKEDMLADEVEALSEYLKKGGRMALLLDPDTPESFRQFLRPWGISLGKGSIVDEKSNLGDNKSTPLVGRFERRHEITSPLGNTYFPGVTSLEPVTEEIPIVRIGDQDVPILVRIPLAETSEDSRLIEDPDKRGPFIIAALIDALASLEQNAPTSGEALNRSTTIVFGDSDFVSNQDFGNLSNGNFFINSVNFLADDVALINIRPKLVTRRELVTTPDQFDVIRYTSWLLIPALMGVAGVFVWWRRR